MGLGDLGNRLGWMDGLKSSRVNQSVSSTTQFLPSDIAGLFAWYRFNTGITVTGSGVSQWNDQTANAVHLKQGTDANRPPKQGDGTILFDGVSQTLITDVFTGTDYPWSVALRLRNVTWVNNKVIVASDDASLTLDLLQQGATPQMETYNGIGLSAPNGDLALNTYGNVFYTSLLAAAGILRVNNGSSVATDSGGISKLINKIALGASTTPGQWSNIQVVELCAYHANLSAANFDSLNTYLNGLGV